MTFDKNQSSFPSAFHREVWWWAVGLVPLSDSLTDDARGRSGPGVLEGCRQWRGYFDELCGDMYEHAAEYAPASARQYRDILENIAAGAALEGDEAVWDGGAWAAYAGKMDRSKAYVTAGVKLERCLAALERTGLRFELADGRAVFRNVKYPKIFHAMSVFERSPDVRQTPARHHFAHCEFRQLYKSYNANYDELLRRASDDSLFVARGIDDFCKSLKIQRYIHFGIIKYKHKGIRVLDFNLYGDEYPTLRVNMGTCADPGRADDVNGDAYYKALLGKSPEIQEKFAKWLVPCENPEHRRYPVAIGGREETVCPCQKLRMNPGRGDLEAIQALIEARKASIEGEGG